MPLIPTATLPIPAAGNGFFIDARRFHTSVHSGARIVAGRKGQQCRSRVQKDIVKAQASSAPQGDNEAPKFALAPSAPTSPVGEMAAYYLQMQPHLFRAAVETEFQKLREVREAASEAQNQTPPTEGGAAEHAESMELVLSRRMEEVRRAEEAVAIEDLMYVCILERFQTLGVELLPQVAPIEESLDALKSLTEGVHTREALDMVKEHVLSVLGPASMAFANTMIKMSKLQSAQVYAASIMFGYFLRRVDSRFQLAKSLGVLPESPEDAMAKLERLFSMADAVEESDDPDAAVPPEPATAAAAGGEAEAEAEGTPASSASTGALAKRPKGALRQYVESFDQETMLATAKLVTTEGAALVERQTKALFGDVKALQTQMQEVVGQDAGSMEELMQRIQKAVADGSVESVTMTVGTQRRAVLEAVAYGCFLRDVESWVDTEYALLTPTSGASA